MVSIYKLIDPITLKVRYIGKTEQTLEKRLYHHIARAKANETSSHCANWIRSLLAKNTRPIIELLEEVTLQNWKEKEIYWISYYKNIEKDLTNFMAGGDGLTSETAKILNSIPEVKKKIQQKSKENWQNPDFREKVMNSLKVSTQKKEYKEKQRENALNMWSNKEFREKMTSKLRIANAKQERKDKISAKTKEFWKDEKYREKALSGLLVSIEKSKKPIMAIDTDGNKYIFESKTEAMKQLGIKSGNGASRALKLGTTTQGYKLSYMEAN